MIFRQKLETTALKVGEAIVMECEVEGDDSDVVAHWYRNDELLMGDIEKNTVLVRYVSSCIYKTRYYERFHATATSKKGVLFYCFLCHYCQHLLFSFQRVEEFSNFYSKRDRLVGSR